MDKQLFEGKLIRLAPLDVEHDVSVESVWTHNASFIRMMYAEPMRPLSPNALKKKYEAAVKNAQPNQFQFMIRLLAEDRLIGLARLVRIDWGNGGARLLLGIADESDRGRGYGSEALALMLNYAFSELNLYRVSASTSEYNEPALAFLQKNNFAIEVRRRQAIHRDGKWWDLIMLGLLREDWSSK
ncbi:MAG: GNAT family N-acetyltransferase [Chloroflexi bacterium]|nr:GNAT family N-acetyltransferase [Chloroflexota bacterium]